MLALSSTRVAVRPTQANRAAMRPSLLSVRAKAPKAPEFSAPALDTEELASKASAAASEAAAVLKAKWEATEDKPAAVLVTAGTVIALSLSLSLVNTIDKIPVVSDLIELIGIGVTAWFTYRYLTVGPDRDELFVSIKSFITKIYGSKF